MAECILSTTTLELHSGKTPEVKGKNFIVCVASRDCLPTFDSFMYSFLKNLKH